MSKTNTKISFEQIITEFVVGQTFDDKNGWNPSFIDEEQPWGFSMVCIRKQKVAAPSFAIHLKVKRDINIYLQNKRKL